MSFGKRGWGMGLGGMGGDTLPKALGVIGALFMFFGATFGGWPTMLLLVIIFGVLLLVFMIKFLWGIAHGEAGEDSWIKKLALAGMVCLLISLFLSMLVPLFG